MSNEICSECGGLEQHAETCSRHPAATSSTKAGYLTPRSGDMTTAFPGFDDSRLRALQLWHWNEFLKFRGLGKFFDSSPLGVYYDAQSNFHIKAVQTLNDCFDIDNTAEKDAQRQTP